MTLYRIADRFSEPSSWIGVGVAAIAAALPALVPPSTWSHAAEFVQTALGTAMFFLPDNRSLAVAQSSFTQLEAALPVAYAVGTQPVAALPAQQTSPAGDAKNAQVSSAASAATGALCTGLPVGTPISSPTPATAPAKPAQ
jgi:hypothetical protein